MARGGKRTAGEGKKIGRPKTERPTNTSVAQRVLAQARAEQIWLDLIDLEKRRLGLEGNYGIRLVSIIPLVNMLRYLECRAYGNPTDTVNHLHSKPIDLNVTLSLGERMKTAMQKAEERVGKRAG